MDTFYFYKYYLPALEKALAHDHEWSNFQVKDPSFYLNSEAVDEHDFDVYLDKCAGKDDFLDMVAYYFDAKSHNFPNIQNVDINDYRSEIIRKIKDLKKLYNL